MSNIKIKQFLIPVTIFVSYICFFQLVSAQGTSYTLLEELPVVGKTVSNFGAYLSNMFKLAIGVATILAISQLSFGGFKYLTTEAFTGVSDAKKKITNALLGLILILSSYLLLRTINPDLVEMNLIIPPVGGGVTQTVDYVLVEESPATTFSEAISDFCLDAETGESVDCQIDVLIPSH